MRNSKILRPFMTTNHSKNCENILHEPPINFPINTALTQANHAHTHSFLWTDSLFLRLIRTTHTVTHLRLTEHQHHLQQHTANLHILKLVYTVFCYTHEWTWHFNNHMEINKQKIIYIFAIVHCGKLNTIHLKGCDVDPHSSTMNSTARHRPSHRIPYTRSTL